MPSFEDLDDSVEPDIDVSEFDPNQQEPEPDFEEQMSEVEMRLEKAYYYRMLLKQNPFDSDSPIADEVWKDISKLLRARLGELLGITVKSVESPAKSQFTEAEAAILKSVASKLLKNADAASKPKQIKKSPGLRKVSVSEVEGSPNKVPAPKQVTKSPEAKPTKIIGKGGKAGAKNKIFKKHIMEDGKELLMDVTPQVKPVGIQPMAMPPLEMANAHATQQAATIAAGQDEGLIELVKAKG